MPAECGSSTCFCALPATPHPGQPSSGAGLPSPSEGGCLPAVPLPLSSSIAPPSRVRLQLHIVLLIFSSSICSFRSLTSPPATSPPRYMHTQFRHKTHLPHIAEHAPIRSSFRREIGFNAYCVLGTILNTKGTMKKTDQNSSLTEFTFWWGNVWP